ncbi:hypothetical protein RF11_06972 [Thelohanellus kitauei]|uniref:ISXO2-like transposase domain-containing protein n=1 Tax=Thelohanellus kitauei TaxID=669202 RepID=A0A0C2IYP8_THEKT|nr:hypothetical protein RF11_06972 [Thelohanellus kitauei]
MVGASLDFEDCTIGRQDITVEIDESKLGMNKYHRGHLVSGPWILGGVEKTRERKAFQVEVPDRTAEILINIIRSSLHGYNFLIVNLNSDYLLQNNIIIEGKDVLYDEITF